MFSRQNDNVGIFHSEFAICYDGYNEKSKAIKSFHRFEKESMKLNDERSKVPCNKCVSLQPFQNAMEFKSKQITIWRRKITQKYITRNCSPFNSFSFNRPKNKPVFVSSFGRFFTFCLRQIQNKKKLNWNMIVSCFKKEILPADWIPGILKPVRFLYIFVNANWEPEISMLSERLTKKSVVVTLTNWKSLRN